MPSIGELFIQLGVMGNANELKNANKELQKANILTQKQAKLDKLRAEALERIQKAQTKQEKREIARQYRAKKAKVEQETSLKLKVAENKALQNNIAQWATYAHAVTMAASVAVNAMKQIYSASDKLLTKGQNWANINATTSLGLGTLQRYGKTANILNPNASEMGTAQSLSTLNTKFTHAKLNPGAAIGGLIDQELAQQLGLDSAEMVEKLYSGEISNAAQYMEYVRGLIAGKSPETQNLIAQAYGVDENLLPMLRLTRVEFEKIAKASNKFALTEEQLETLNRYKIEIGIIQKQLTDMFDQVVYDYTPYVKDIVVKVGDLAKELFPEIKRVIGEIKDEFSKISYNDFKDAMKLVLETTELIVKAVAKAIEGWIELLSYIEKFKGNSEQNIGTEKILADQKTQIADAKKDFIGGYVGRSQQELLKGLDFTNLKTWIPGYNMYSTYLKPAIDTWKEQHSGNSNINSNNEITNNFYGASVEQMKEVIDYANDRKNTINQYNMGYN